MNHLNETSKPLVVCHRVGNREWRDVSLVVRHRNRVWSGEWTPAAGADPVIVTAATRRELEPQLPFRIVLKGGAR